MIYLITFIVLIVNARFLRIFKGNYNKMVVYSSFFILFLVQAFRSTDVGEDINRYYEKFVEMSQMEWSLIFDKQRMESGFLVLLKILSTVSINKTFFLASMSFLILFPMFTVYANNTENPLLTILIFYLIGLYAFTFSGLRQSLAMSICLYGYKYVKNKQWIRYIIVVLVGILFHKTSVIAFLIIPCYCINLKSYAFIITILSSAILIIFKVQISMMLVKILVKLSSSYEYYQIVDTGAYTMIIAYAIIYVGVFLFSSKEADNQWIKNTAGIILLLQIFSLINNNAARFNLYFIIYLPIIIPKMISEIKQRDGKVVSASVSCLFILFCILLFIQSLNNDLKFYPYSFIFSW